MKLLLLMALGTAAAFFPQVSAADNAASTGTDVAPVADVSFTLRTEIGDGKLVFVGQSGPIKGEVNPDLRVPEGAVVQITVVNGDGALHDIAVTEFDAQSDQIAGQGAATTIVFRATRAGLFEYWCTIPGHKAAGMAGNLIVGDPAVAAADSAVDVAQDPYAVGEPVGDREPRRITYDLRTTEVEGTLSDFQLSCNWRNL